MKKVFFITLLLSSTYTFAQNKLDTAALTQQWRDAIEKRKNEMYTPERMPNAFSGKVLFDTLSNNKKDEFSVLKSKLDGMNIYVPNQSYPDNMPIAVYRQPNTQAITPLSKIDTGYIDSQKNKPLPFNQKSFYKKYSTPK